MTFSDLYEKKIAIIGLGYVGLPLALAFSQKFSVTGFDVNPERIAELKSCRDKTLEVSEAELRNSNIVLFTSEVTDIADCEIYIVTVPTPITEDKKPDLDPLKAASSLVGQLLSPNNVVIFESTVYPGATEDVCAPILEEKSGLKYANEATLQTERVFYLGYSPERINPGDRKHRLQDIVKVTSGSTAEAANFVDDLYSSVVTAGTHKAKSIKTAEAAKVIENTQRDLNIALINELAVLFDKMELDTEAILEAARTKWNFLPFRPGLVGGHCIGVDPYYLTYKAQEIGYSPEVILAGRRINDSMSRFVVDKIISLMSEKNIDVKNSKILVLGLAFKENCPDMRNSKVIEMVNALSDYDAILDVFDPLVEPSKVPDNLKGNFIVEPNSNSYDCVILAVLHDILLSLGAEKIRAFGKTKHIFFDLKYGFDIGESDGRI